MKKNNDGTDVFFPLEIRQLAWDLFEGSGSPGYYLLYKEFVGNGESKDKK